jgi:hypothetical protein
MCTTEQPFDGGGKNKVLATTQNNEQKNQVFSSHLKGNSFDDVERLVHLQLKRIRLSAICIGQRQQIFWRQKKSQQTTTKYKHTHTHTAPLPVERM